MYTKIFKTIYDGTLADDWKALVTFQQLCVLADADGFVDMTVSALSHRTGIPTEILDAGIKSLESEDPSSRTPDLDGRRITRIDDHRDWGWFVVNHAKYRDMGDVEKVRAKNRERAARYRERQRAVGSEHSMESGCDCHAHNVTSRYGNAKSRHKEKDKEKKKIILTSSGSDEALANSTTAPHGKSYRTKKGRDLVGKRLADFNSFWSAFDHKTGKAEAADAWLEIPGYDDQLVETIIAAAKVESKRREQITKSGQIPKMAQGWITGRRWEDNFRDPDADGLNWRGAL